MPEPREAPFSFTSHAAGALETHARATARKVRLLAAADGFADGLRIELDGREGHPLDVMHKEGLRARPRRPVLRRVACASPLGASRQVGDVRDRVRSDG